MKLAASFRGVDTVSFGMGLLVGCFLVSLTYVTMNKSETLPMFVSQTPSSTDRASESSSVKNFNSSQQLDSKDKEGISLQCDTNSSKYEVDDGSNVMNNVNTTVFLKKNVNTTVGDQKQTPATSDSNKPDSKVIEEGISPQCDQNASECEADGGSEVVNNGHTSVEQMQTPVSSDSMKPEVEEEMRPMCDSSNRRCDICDLHGDVRINGKNLSSVILLTPSQAGRNESWKVKPYSRKWDGGAVHNVREVNVRSLSDPSAAPQCTVSHTVPAVVFSTAGYVGNYFHDYTDVLVPVFQTAAQFGGEVQFVITTYKFWWINKYKPFFEKLSRYEIIDFDEDPRVHCFEHVIVGLRSDEDLTIDPAKSPMGFTMVDFIRFMRSAYSLDRDYALRIGAQAQGKKPRLLIVSRSRTRKFMNADKIAGLAKKVGFEVVVQEGASDVANFSRIVNSCDAMMGVHGAGLTNSVFLPTNAVLIQVVPFGRLDWAARTYFGNPSKGMKLKYLEYTIREEESTLTELYPKDDPVFKDPMSIQKLGWFKMGAIYLDKQNVRLNLKRFRPVLVKALQLLRE